jgi:hypothetical protein
MRTEPPFNINEPFPNPDEIKPIKPIEKDQPVDGEKKGDQKNKDFEKKEKQKVPPVDPFGNLGNKIDITI